MQTEAMFKGLSIKPTANGNITVVTLVIPSTPRAELTRLVGSMVRVDIQEPQMSLFAQEEEEEPQREAPRKRS